MENKKLTCSDCKKEFVCEHDFDHEMYPDNCDCYECDSCDKITCDECVDDNGYQLYCKTCYNLIQMRIKCNK